MQSSNLHNLADKMRLEPADRETGLASIGVALFLVGAIALAYLPTLGLTLVYDLRAVVGSLFFFALTLVFFALVWRVSRLVAGDSLASVFVFVSGLMAVTTAAGVFPLVANAAHIVSLLAAGMFLLSSRRAAPRNVASLCAFVVFAILALLLLPSYLIPSGFYEYTGAFFVQAMLPLKKFSDLLYHHTLVSSILGTGIAATGLNGVLADPYHIGGHYFLAGVMRFLHLPIETAPGVLTRATGITLELTTVMLVVYGLRGAIIRGASGHASPVMNAPAMALVAGSIWIVAERSCSVFFPAASNHIGIISSATSLPSAGLLAIFSILVATAHAGLRKELLGFRYVCIGLIVLAFACMSKISTGLMAYCVVTAGYAGVALFTSDRRDGVVKGAAWILGGALVLYASYKYVAAIGTSGSLFDLETALLILSQTRGWAWSSLYIAAASFGLWTAYLVVSKTASAASIARLAAIHVATPLACIIVIFSAVVDRRGDMAYFWISSVQISFFSSVVAITLLVGLLIERMASTDGVHTITLSHRVRMAAIAASLIAAGVGSWHLYEEVQEQQQHMSQQLCELIGQKRCGSLRQAGPNEIIRAASPASPVAKIAYLVRSRGLTSDPNLMLVIDKRTGFFKSQGKRTLKMNGCYYQGWILYMLTGIPQAWGVPTGEEKQGLCETPSAGQQDMWRRYGFASYPPGTGIAKEHSAASLREECNDAQYRNKRFFYIDKDFKGALIDCKRVN